MDEVRDSKTRPPRQPRLNLSRVMSFPYEGKGDRFAVDEVNMSPAPLRGASKDALGTRSHAHF